MEDKDLKELIKIVRRFKNHAYIHGYPSKSFEGKVKQVLKKYNDVIV